VYHSFKDREYVNLIMVIPKGMIIDYWEYEFNVTS